MTTADNDATRGPAAIIRGGGSLSNTEDQTREAQRKPWRPIQLSRQQRCSQAIQYRSCHVPIVSDAGPPLGHWNAFRNNAEILSSPQGCDLCRIACSRYLGRSYSFPTRFDSQGLSKGGGGDGLDDQDRCSLVIGIFPICGAGRRLILAF